MRAGRTASKIWFFSLFVAIIATGTICRASFAGEKPTSDLEALKFIQGDEKTNEMRALKTELMIARSEVRAIAQAKKLIKKYKGTRLEPELQFRLAELHMRRAKTARFFELHRQSETVVRVAPKVVANANSRLHVENAIATYDYIQKKFPTFAQLDLVIFNNAFARQQLGQDREAERLYWTLIQNFRSSMLVPDCHLAIGEINFDRANFSFALEHFNAIAKFPESRVYPYGLYKAAWSHYNMHNPELGLKKLEEVVAYGKYVKENKIESRLDLRKEALADMTVFFEDVYPAKTAMAYFKSQAAELDLAPILLKLAKIYERHSRHQDRETVLHDFIARLPDSPMVAEIHGELIWNFDSMKKKDRAVAQMEKLHQLCLADSEWMKAQRQSMTKGSPDPRDSCLHTLNEASVRLAGRWLKIWKKTQSATDYADAAEKAFEIFLRDPGSSKEASEARYAYAELLFQRQKFRQASQQYATVSGEKTATNIKHEASYAAVVSLEKAVGDKWSDADEKNFHTLAQAYVTNNPKGQFRVDIEFKVGLIAYEKERFAEAGPIFLRLGHDFPNSEKGKKAQDLYMDILNLKKDYKGLKEYASDLLKAENETGRRGKLQKIHEQAYFMQVQSLEESQKYPEAISGYKAFATRNPTSDLAEKAWWNAVQLHFKIMDYSGGAKAAEDYNVKFPTAKNGLDALLKAAESYESMAMLEKAADVLIKIAKAEPKNANKWNSLAADFYILSNRPTAAKSLLTDLRKSDDAQVRQQALEKMLLVERENNGESYRTVLQQMADSGVQPQASLARVELVEELYRSGKATEAFNEAKHVVGAGGASPYAKSRARLIQARVLETEFLQQSVKSRAEKVATVLAIKTEKLEKAQQAFQQAIKYGEPNVAVESLRRLAGCYLHYIEALKTMPLPVGLSQDEGTIFREELSKLSIPLEEKAIETLQEGIKAAQRLRVEGLPVAEMKKELRRMNMPLPSGEGVEFGDPGMILPAIAEVGS